MSISTFFSTPLLFWLKFGVVPLGVDPSCWGLQRFNNSNLYDHDTSTSRTDIGTDGQLALAIPRYA